MMIGLDLPQIIAELENVSISKAIGYGVLITGVVILIHHGLATIALDFQFAMCEGSDVIISEHVCLVENLEIIK